METIANAAPQWAAGLSPDQIVTAIYRALLSREPEEGAIQHWRKQIGGTAELAKTLADFLRSPEFQSKIGHFTDIHRYDSADGQKIESEIDRNKLEVLWNHVRKTWMQLGADEPFFSVLTDSRFLSSAMAKNSEIESFYASGTGDVSRFERWLARNGVAPKTDGVFVEYGCGLGRCTELFAERFNHVIAMDISRNHLDFALKRGESHNIRNVEYVCVQSLADIDRLEATDVFYSVIVLQHNPPPIIHYILDRAFSGLKSGGVAYFQVPTRGADGYEFNFQEYIARLDKEEMEMHAIDQSAVFQLAERHRLRPIEVSPDHCTGGLGVSTTFLLRKT